MPRFCSRKNRAHSKCQIQYKITTLLNGTNGKEHPQLRRHSVYSAAPALSPTVSIKRIQVTMVRRQAQSSPHIQKTWVRQFNNGCSLYRHQRKFLCKKKNALIFFDFFDLCFVPKSSKRFGRASTQRFSCSLCGRMASTYAPVEARGDW